jgi:hypothetical protein
MHHRCMPPDNDSADSQQANDERERVRVALNLLKTEFDELKQLAQDDGETVTGYLRKALATERYLKERTKSGGRVLIEEDGQQREIVFR